MFSGLWNNKLQFIDMEFIRREILQAVESRSICLSEMITINDTYLHLRVMYRRNEMNEGNESCISDESSSGRKSCAGNGRPTNGGWQRTPTVVGNVRRPGEVYIAPIAPIGNQVVLPGRLLHICSHLEPW